MLITWLQLSMMCHTACIITDDQMTMIFRIETVYRLEHTKKYLMSRIKGNGFFPKSLNYFSFRWLRWEVSKIMRATPCATTLDLRSRWMDEFWPNTCEKNKRGVGWGVERERERERERRGWGKKEVDASSAPTPRLLGHFTLNQFLLSSFSRGQTLPAGARFTGWLEKPQPVHSCIDLFCKRLVLGVSIITSLSLFERNLNKQQLSICCFKFFCPS